MPNNQGITGLEDPTDDRVFRSYQRASVKNHSCFMGPSTVCKVLALHAASYGTLYRSPAPLRMISELRVRSKP